MHKNFIIKIILMMFENEEKNQQDTFQIDLKITNIK